MLGKAQPQEQETSHVISTVRKQRANMGSQLPCFILCAQDLAPEIVQHAQVSLSTSLKLTETIPSSMPGDLALLQSRSCEGTGQPITKRHCCGPSSLQAFTITLDHRRPLIW